VEAVRKGLNVAGTELMTLRAAPTAQDLYRACALRSAGCSANAGAGAWTRGERRATPISFSPVMETDAQRFGGKSDWVSRIGARVLPSGVNAVDDPGAKEFKGTPLIGGYAVDDEGVRAQRVTLVENGKLQSALMSRRPGQTPINPTAMVAPRS